MGNATFVEVLPTSYNFGNSDVANGVVVSTNFTVKNIAPTGGTRYIGIAFAVSGANANDFTARSTDCANALPPGGICTVTVDFKAGAVGSRIGVLDVSAHEPGMANISLGLDKAGLSGNGI